MYWWRLSDQIIIRIEKQPRKSGGPRTVVVYKCAKDDCSEEIKIRNGMFNKHSKFCKIHSHQKRPFESIYNGLKKDWRKTEVTLTYEEYLIFTKEKECHYCQSEIPWNPYGTVSGKFISRAYFLDRKDNSGPYSFENCVVCCFKCNKMKGGWYSYEEFIQIIQLLKNLRKTEPTFHKE